MRAVGVCVRGCRKSRRVEVSDKDGRLQMVGRKAKKKKKKNKKKLYSFYTYIYKYFFF
jgi:hypothetical protein